MDKADARLIGASWQGRSVNDVGPGGEYSPTAVGFVQHCEARRLTITLRSACGAIRGKPVVIRRRGRGDTEPEPAPIGGGRGLGRRSLDALRVGVLVLDAEDRPVLANPAAKEMGLLRAGTTVGGSPVAHTVVRTLAGQARRTGSRREVELDLPRGNGRDPLGVHIRAVALGDGHVTIEAADVTEAHRVARVRRDFVANVSHELKTPVGALQLLAEALLDATDLAADSTDEELGSEDMRRDLAAARRFAERIQHESTRLGRLVSELLDLT